MDTLRVDICYRPLRIGWAIAANDIEAFRKAVRLSHTLWGGRFNPILVADNEAETKQFIDLFRVDVILPIGEGEEVKALPKKFPHLMNPLISNSLFVGGAYNQKHAQVLDLHNGLLHMRDRPWWASFQKQGVRLYAWEPDDPLADVFLIQFGTYPSVEETSIDYRRVLAHVAEATDHRLAPGDVVPADSTDHPNIGVVSKLTIERHHAVVGSSRNNPGFFVGDASTLDDLVAYWNLRAADILLWFVDPNHLARYAEIIPAWEKAMRETVAHRHEWERDLAVWSRRADADAVVKPFGDMKLRFRRISHRGPTVAAPMMTLGEASVLGVVGHEAGKPKVAFPLNEKPFTPDVWFHTQHLVASLSFLGGLYDDQTTLRPPYLPELNEFYARTMHIHHDRLRIEPGRIGLIINAADHDQSLYALPVADMMERLFGMAGYEVKMSSADLIVRQLIARLGGLQGARVFKIPGVRRLLRTHGPTATFTKKSALQLIASKDPVNPDANFKDHEGLYIEQRPREIRTLHPDAVFGYLVEKGLFRIGAELTCPSCRMPSWTALDMLKQRVVCELCGHEHDATRQLVNGEWHYRRSGVMGAEKNAQGAVPVALTLQQLETSLRGIDHDIYSPSLNLEPKAGVDLPTCEVDFVWVIPRSNPPRTVVLLGECKDQGLIKPEEFERDLENLHRVADALPVGRFEKFVVLSKLARFTPEEIEMVRLLNEKYHRRAILLSARELEPYWMYERAKAELGVDLHWSRPEDLVEATTKIYFSAKKQAD